MFNLRVSKKSQAHTQIFIYIIAMILFSFILIYGYNAIKGFKDKSEQIAYIKFKTDLVSTVKRISPDYGTLKREEFFIGGEYSKVCFVQSYKRGVLTTFVSTTDWKDDLIVKDSVEGGVDKNVFLFTTTFQESFDIGKITVGTNIKYDCIPVINGKVKIQFLGQGDHTDISQW